MLVIVAYTYTIYTCFRERAQVTFLSQVIYVRQ